MNRKLYSTKTIKLFVLLLISSINSNSQTLSSKLTENLEIILSDYYIRLVQTKRYVDHSAKNFKIVSKDANGNPTHVKFDYDFYDNEELKKFSVTGEILYYKSSAYGLMTYYNDFQCTTPAKIVNGVITSRTENEVLQIRKLQLKFLSVKMRDRIRELWKDYEYKSAYSCLETYYVYRTTYEESTTGFFNSKVIVKNKTLDRIEWKNVCSELVLIGGVGVIVYPNSISLNPELIKINPGDYGPKVKISNLNDENMGNFNSQGYQIYFFL